MGCADEILGGYAWAVLPSICLLATYVYDHNPMKISLRFAFDCVAAACAYTRAIDRSSRAGDRSFLVLTS